MLTQQALRHDAIAATGTAGVWLLPAGQRPPGPNELLGSRAFLNVLSESRSEFDWIVIDTPPVLAVTDAMILAPLVSAVTFVIGAEMTRQRLAERAVETMLSSNPRLVLAVLNKVDVGRNKYYYSRYYGHQYKNYYAESPAA